MGDFSPDKIRKTKTNWGKNVVFVETIVALTTPVTLVTKIIRILPKEKYIQGKIMPS